MSAGDNIIVGVRSGVFHPQADATFTETEPGEWDTGQRVFLTRATTPERSWPRRGDQDSEHRYMFAIAVTQRLIECGLREFTVNFRGSLRADKPAKLRKGCGTQMFTLPSRASEDAPRINYVAPVPMPTVRRSYIAREQPSNTGVSLAVSADFLPTPPSFSISFIPDPDAPATLNYRTGWVLESREWEETDVPVWPVEEFYTYYYSIAV